MRGRAGRATLQLDDEEKSVMRCLRLSGPASRSALASALKMSPAKLTKLSQRLLALGVVEEADGVGAHGRGRPVVPLRIASTGGYAAGITAHKGVLDLVLADYAGHVIAQSAEPFHDRDPKALCRAARARLLDMIDRHDLVGGRLLGAGLGMPGLASSADGERWRTVPDLWGADDVPIRAMMEDALALPVWIENDATATALAEYYAGGLTDGCSTMVAILLGHGIGAGVIVDGRLLRGAMRNAGDIGIFYPTDRPRPSPIDLLSVLRADGCAIESVADFGTKASQHQPVVNAWLVRAADQLRLVIESALAWFDPDRIILSGPLPRPLMVQLADRLNAAGIWRGPCSMFMPEVAASRLGGGAIALGAALLPIHATIAL
ncbi:ROK family protein [Sphingomonas nostoxanthinifaciens]|uniref:ROK family protein n=1 Tax=Sphingomonas nostoxanthinifaciens TaxID=2872652 RepID=UPI001CC20D05|nr:ROK family protein [Sphingomonas nostoxanthinifaciens]UAK25773.1 ROK family protein [Sphingomonas nostoxanthinifaciens]